MSKRRIYLICFILTAITIQLFFSGDPINRRNLIVPYNSHRIDILALSEKRLSDNYAFGSSYHTIIPHHKNSINGSIMIITAISNGSLLADVTYQIFPNPFNRAQVPYTITDNHINDSNSVLGITDIKGVRDGLYNITQVRIPADIYGIITENNLVERGNIDKLHNNETAIFVVDDVTLSGNSSTASYFSISGEKNKISNNTSFLKKIPNSGLASILFNNGVSLSKIGQYDDAIRFYTRSMKLQTNNTVNSLYNIANDLFRLGRYNEAIINYNKLLSKVPYDIHALVNVGLALSFEGKYSESLVYYDKVLQRDPLNIDALKAKGISLWQLNRYNEAITSMDNPFRIDPNYNIPLSHK